MRRLLPYLAILLAGAAGVSLPAFAEDTRTKTHQTADVQLPPVTVEFLTAPTQKGDMADWGHAAIGVPDAWKYTKGKGAIVAVLDTGYDFKHPDLMYQYVEGAKDFSGSRSGPWDKHGHGTHCAGIIAAREDGKGVVGVAPEAKILPVKVLDDWGMGSNRGIADGIRYATDKGAHVISMSLGGSGVSREIHDAIKYATGKGVIVVAAAGNSGPGDNTVDYPGGHPECVCVAAIDRTLKVARFSSRGRQVDIAAPGVDVQSTYPGGKFAKMSGTSMATPYVAGVAALYVSSCQLTNRTPWPEEFMRRLKAGADDLPPKGADTASGAGLVKPAKVIWVKADWEIIPPPREVKQ